MINETKQESFNLCLITQKIQKDAYIKGGTRIICDAFIFGPKAISINSNIIQFRIATAEVYFTDEDESYGNISITPKFRYEETTRHQLLDPENFDFNIDLFVSKKYNEIFINDAKIKITARITPNNELASDDNELYSRCSVGIFTEHARIEDDTWREILEDAISVNLKKLFNESWGSSRTICREIAENSNISTILASPKGSEIVSNLLHLLRLALYKEISLDNHGNLWSLELKEFILYAKKLENFKVLKSCFDNPSINNVDFNALLRHGENKFNGLDESIYEINLETLNSCSESILKLKTSYSETIERIVIKAYLYSIIITRLRALEPIDVGYDLKIIANKFTGKVYNRKGIQIFSELALELIKEAGVILITYMFAVAISNQNPISTWIITVALTLWRWGSNVAVARDKNLDSQRKWNTTEGLINLFNYVSQDVYDPLTALQMAEREIIQNGIFLNPFLTLLLRKGASRWSKDNALDSSKRPN